MCAKVLVPFGAKVLVLVSKLSADRPIDRISSDANPDPLYIV